MHLITCCNYSPCFGRAWVFRLAFFVLFLGQLGAFAQSPISVWDNFVANSDGSWYEFDAENTSLSDGYIDGNTIKAQFNASDFFMGLRYKDTRFKFESTVPEMGIPGLLTFTPTGANNANYYERIAVPKTKDKDYTPAREVAVRMDYFLVNPGASKSGNLETDLRTYYPEPHVKRNGLTTFSDQPGAGTNPVPDGGGAEFVLLSQYGPDTYNNNFPYGNKGDLYGEQLPQGYTTFDLTGTYENFNPNSPTYQKDRTVFAVGVYAHDVTDYNYQSQIYPCYPGTNVRLTVPSNELIQNRFLIGLNTVTNGVSNGDGYFYWWMKIPSINNGEWFLAAYLTNRDFTGDAAMKFATLGLGQYNGGNGKGYYLDNGNTANGLWYHNMSAWYSTSGGNGIKTPPNVALTAPSNGASFSAGSTVNLTAAASDADGTVSKVEFYRNGTTLIGTDNTAPYQFNWTNVPAGTYTIVAKATDNDGQSTTSGAATITVLPPGQVPPSVTLTGPANGATYKPGDNVTITATATDADGSVVKVDFYQGNTLLGTDATAPYSFTWNQPAAGTYNLKAVATDNSTLTSASGTNTITVQAPKSPPTVNITTPATNTLYTQGTNIHIEAYATDADGSIDRVEFYAGSTFIKTEYQEPYQADWGNAPVGTHVLTAVAYDNEGQKTTSQGVTVVVGTSSGGGGPISNPVVQFMSPNDGQQFNVGDDIAVEASASDADGSIAQIDFYLNGTWYKTEKVIPYEAPLQNVQQGTHTLMAIAQDNDGYKDTALITIHVGTTSGGGGGSGGGSGGGVTGAPQVDIIYPTDGAKFNQGDNLPIEADAIDGDGSIDRVQFFLNGTLYKTEKVIPYEAPLNNVQPGSYTLMAIAWDNEGKTDTSIVHYTVIQPNSGPPTCEIIDPLDGEQFLVGDDINVEALATDGDGFIAKVEFFLNGSKYKTEKVAKYEAPLFNVQQGVYELMAIAYDNDGYRDTSIIHFIVGSGNTPQPPVVSITSPKDGDQFKAGSDIVVTADASDPDGNVVKVDLYVGNTLLNSAASAPYKAQWLNVQPGTYVLRAIAYDDDGQSTVSSKVIVTVSGDLPSVTGLTFEAIEDEGLVILSWTAQEEVNVGSYRLTRSQDSILYEDLSEVPAVGNSTVPTSYDEIDPEPFADATWYKLEALAVDGTVLETIIVKVDMSEPKLLEKWIVYPNPLTGNKPIKIWAQLTQDVEVTVELTSVYGQTMFKQNYQFTGGANKETIGLQTLPPGIYFFTLRVTNSGEVLDTQMFIKTP